MQKSVLLLLDFDGTPAPITGKNEAARLTEEIRGLLGTFLGRPDVGVAVLSGRSLDDLKSRLDMPSLYYGGNHGLEIAGPGIPSRSHWVTTRSTRTSSPP